MKIPYARTPNALRKFIKGIPDRNIPSKVDGGYLKSIGLKNTNDQSVVPVLKSVDLLDASGKPTDAYRGFRDKVRGPLILGDRLRKAYAILFNVFEDANSRNDSELNNVLATHIEGGARVQQMILATFKVLCEFASFSQGVTGAPVTPAAGASVYQAPQAVGTPRIETHLNIQLHLPETKDASVYDAIFESLVRNLKRLP